MYFLTAKNDLGSAGRSILNAQKNPAEGDRIVPRSCSGDTTVCLNRYLCTSVSAAFCPFARHHWERSGAVAFTPRTPGVTRTGKRPNGPSPAASPVWQTLRSLRSKRGHYQVHGQGIKCSDFWRSLDSRWTWNTTNCRRWPTTPGANQGGEPGCLNGTAATDCRTGGGTTLKGEEKLIPQSKQLPPPAACWPKPLTDLPNNWNT